MGITFPFSSCSDSVLKILALSLFWFWRMILILLRPSGPSHPSGPSARCKADIHHGIVIHSLSNHDRSESQTVNKPTTERAGALSSSITSNSNLLLSADLRLFMHFASQTCLLDWSLDIKIHSQFSISGRSRASLEPHKLLSVLNRFRTHMEVSDLDPIVEAM